MHFSPKFNFTIRHCSHYSSLRKLPKLRKIANYHRPQAILQALIEYLYRARSLPFTHAENIETTHSSRSPNSSPKSNSRHELLQKLPQFLGYHPIDKFDFFFESIGIPYWEIKVENEFKKGLEKIKSRREHRGTMERLNFLLGIGFGQNLVMIKVLSGLHGSRAQLQERFNLLLNLGIKYPNLCKIVYCRVKALNQNPAMLEEKVNYLQFGLGCSLLYLDVYPGFLCFNLENRIKPRCAIHQWLFEKGLVRRKYRITSMISPSEKTIIARLYNIHPSNPKTVVGEPI
ncbi:hypothetical protein Syun_018488 [Stephania yunnanensis]|uniref:Uncharacterized protein n=1 Tax=Stephania yunnanensis TaxID=152371 RepID=A0AAP0IUN3_9MAGN